MVRNLAVAAGVVVAAVIAVLLLVQGDSSNSPSESPNRQRASTADMTAGSAPGDLAEGSVDVAALTENISETAEIDLGEGPAALSGVVHGLFNNLESGAEVTLYKVQLPASLSDDQGIPFWRFFRNDFDLDKELEGATASIARVVADDAGHYAFQGLAAGSYVVAARGVNSLNTPAEHIEYLDAPWVQNIRLREAGSIEGRVVSPTGDAIGEAVVSLSGIVMEMNRGFQGNLSTEDAILYALNPVSAKSTSDRQGRFVFRQLPQLGYQVAAECLPWAHATESTEVPQNDPLEIVMQPGATVIGKVVDDRGVAIANAEVVMEVSWTERRRNFRGFGSRNSNQEATSDEQGLFRFEGIAQGEFRLQASRAGYQPKSVENIATVAGEQTDVVLLEMPPGFVIAGIVRAEGKDPVAGVTVRATANDNGGGRGGRGARVGRGGPFGNRPSVTTDAQGEFRFDTLSEGAYRLNFEHDAWSDQRVETNTGETRLQVDLAPAVMIRGRVVDTDGKPLVRARVSVRGDGRQSNRTRTDEDGNFSVARADGENTFSINAKGFLDWEEQLPDDDNTLGDIEMAPAILVSGVVIGPDGELLAGARVSAREDLGDGGFGGFGGQTGNQQGRGARRGGRGAQQGGGGRGGMRGFFGNTSSTTSQDDGSFVLELTSVGGLWNITATHQAMLEATAEVEASVSITDLTLQLDWGAIVAGVVLSAEGKPVPHARLSLRSNADRGGGGFGGRAGRLGGGSETRADGTFLLSGYEEGEYRLSVNAKGFAPHEQDLSLARNQQLRNLEIRLAPEVVLTGIVQDPSGNPIEGARVFVSAQSDVSADAGNGNGGRGRGGRGGRGRNGGMTMSSPDGSFRVPQLKAVPYDVRVNCDGFQDSSLEGIDPARALVVVLQPTLSFVGIVIDANTSIPIAGARVSARVATQDDNGGRGGRGRGARSNAESNADGAFTLTDLEQGGYELTVRHDEYANFATEISVPQGSASFVATLVPGMRLYGHVFDHASRPIAGTRVSAYPLSTVIDTPVLSSANIVAGGARGNGGSSAAGDNGGGTRRARPTARANTDADGNFELRGLQAGDYRLEFDNSDFLPAELEKITLTEGTDKEVRQRLDLGAEIEGRVLDAAGEEMAGIVQVTGDGFDFDRRVRIENGRYRIAGLPEGSYQVSYRAGFRGNGGGGDNAEVVQVKERQRLKHDLHPES